jgi:hypothetical protein
MGFSNQDFDTRLQVVEDKVKFFMSNFKVRRITGTGLLDQNGQPTATVEEITLEQHYRDLITGMLVPVKDDDGVSTEQSPATE